MQCEPPDKQFFAEISDLNLGFLRLVADPSADADALNLLSVPTESAAALQNLAPAELARVARAPVLLARLDDLPLDNSVAEPGPLPPGLDPDWSRAASLFAAGLLTYLWQLARHQPIAAALCLGPDHRRVQALARLSCREIFTYSSVAAARLRARRVFRSPFLPGLLRTARGCPVAEALPGLELIPLGLSQLRPGCARRNL